MDSTVKSPCIKQCGLNDKNICRGCFRTLEEVILWPAEDDTGRMKILASAESRKKRAEKKP